MAGADTRWRFVETAPPQGLPAGTRRREPPLSGDSMDFFKALMLTDMAVRIAVLSLAGALALALANLVALARKHRGGRN